MKKMLPFFIILLLIVAGSSFYGGMKYGESRGSGRDFGAMQQRQQFGGPGRLNNSQSGASFIDGDILSKDEKSSTVKLRDGGSKIIFISDTTQVMTMATTSLDSLQTDMGVMISGTSNTDGSLTAKSIQIRPNVPISQPNN